MTLVKFGDVITINPKEKLPKGTSAPKVAMEGIQPFTKYISSYVFEEYAGGAKFRNGDTLLARITPSLENGKTSIVSELPTDSVGFGSTEFLVFRATNQILPDYLYYLTTTPNFRDMAIKSMTGTSGRQRVQTDVVSDYEFDLPSIEQQKFVIDKLVPLDAKIRLNNQINDNLQAISSAVWDSLDKHRQITLSDLMTIKSGKRPPVKASEKDDLHKIPIIGASKIMGYTNDILSAESIITTGRVGTHGVIQRYREPVWISDNSFVITSNYEESVYQLLQKVDYDSLNRGTTQPLITQTDLKKYEFYVPTDEDMEIFEKYATKLTELIFNNDAQVKTLTKIRDQLLKELIN